MKRIEKELEDILKVVTAWETFKVVYKMENDEGYEEKEIKGISILEAVSDTRKWEHILEDLEKEEARYMKLVELKKGGYKKWL